MGRKMPRALDAKSIAATTAWRVGHMGHLKDCKLALSEPWMGKTYKKTLLYTKLRTLTPDSA